MQQITNGKRRMMPYVLLSRTKDSLRSASSLQMSTRNASASAPRFLYSWSCGERYLSTAFLTHLLLTILPKVRQEITWLILLAPAWLRQFWLQHPAFVPPFYTELSQIWHPNLTSFHIILWALSGFQALNLTCSSSTSDIFSNSRNNSKNSRSSHMNHVFYMNYCKGSTSLMSLLPI